MARTSSLAVGWFLTVVFVLSAARSADACDPCSLYNASRLQANAPKSLSLSISEQYSNFSRATSSTESTLRDAEFVRSYSTTQFALSYDLNQDWSVQANIPLIVRRFDEIEQYRASTETESGIGDVSLLADYSFFEHETLNSFTIASFLGGVKFPTGDSGVLEELHTNDKAFAGESLLRHHQISSASGGRALTLGSGSYDYILGLNLLSRYKRLLVLSTAQYSIRTEGDFNYEFADDFIWSIGSGFYFALNHSLTAAGLIVFSGEFKGKDHLDGELVGGSQFSNLYLGPQAIFTLNESLAAEISFDFRVTEEDKDASVVPENRIRASLSYRFG